MDNLTKFQLKSDNKIKINFVCEDLSSDSGLLLIKEFVQMIGFHKIIKMHLKLMT